MKGNLKWVSIGAGGLLYGVGSEDVVYTANASRIGTAAGGPPAPPDLNELLGDEAQKIAEKIWEKFSKETTGSPYANQTSYRESAHAFGRKLGPEMLAMAGVKTPVDFDKGRDGLLDLLYLRMEGFAGDYVARITTIHKVLENIEPLRAQVWEQQPGEAKGDNADFNRQFDAFKGVLAGGLATNFSAGAKTPNIQKSAMQFAMARVEDFAKGYAKQKIDANNGKKEAEERAKRAPENCTRENRVCAGCPRNDQCDGPCCGMRYPCNFRWDGNCNCATLTYPDVVCVARNAWKTATQWLTDIWESAKRSVSQAWESIKGWSQKAWAKLQEFKQWQDEKWEQTKKFVAEKWEDFKQFVDVDALLKNPLDWAWKKMKDQLFKPVIDFMKDAKETLQKGLKALVDAAKNAAAGLLREHVMVPAIKWAVGRIFGENAYEKLMSVAKKVLGKVETSVARTQAAERALAALAQKDLAKFDAAMATHSAEVGKLRDMKVTGLITAIVEYAEERLELFIRAKATGLINGAFRMVETPINIGKAAVCASVGWIPFIGGVLSGAADYLITEGLVKLREIIIEFVVGKILEFVKPMIEKLASVLKDGGAKAEEFLQPVFDAVRPVLADIQARVDRVLAAETALAANLAKARARIASVNAASVKAGAGGGR